MQTIISCDFSLNKTAICINNNNKFIFFIWPFNVKQKFVDNIKDNGVNVIERVEERPKDISASDRVRYDIINSTKLADLIINTIKSYINNETIFVFEGSSFSSKGTHALQLTSYRYILVYKLSLIMPLKNIYSYSPITLKATAECAKKGMTKEDMIKAFIQRGPDCIFRKALKDKKLLKPKGNKWIDMIDDCVDAYWAGETYIKKEC